MNVGLSAANVDPLTMGLIADVSKRWRCIPSVYNRMCLARFERVLQKRDTGTVDQLWRPIASIDLVDRVSRVIRENFRWSSGNFVPTDECRVLFMGWRVGIGDAMERESCFLGFDAIAGRELAVPEGTKLDRILFVDLINLLKG